MGKTTEYGTAIWAGLLAACMVLSAGVAQAQKIFTDNDANNPNWNNPGNWDPHGKPGAGDTARIQDGKTALITEEDQAAATVQLVQDANSGDGTLEILNNRTLTVSGAIGVGNNGNHWGTLRQINGNLTSGTTVVGNSGVVNGVYEHTAGIHATDNLHIGYATTGINAAANGTYRVLGASATLVAGTAVLGDGVVAADRFGGLNVDVSGASISFGRFTQNVNGTLGFTADANGFSTINVTGTGDGTVTLGGTLWVDFGLYEGNALELILISNTGSGPIFGTFDTVILMNNTRGYELTYTGGTGNDLALIANPPGSEWNNPGNWDPHGKPVAGDTARIQENETALITEEDQAAAIVQLVQDANSGDGTLEILNNRTLTVIGAIGVGNNGNHWGTLRQINGNLTSGTTIVGNSGAVMGVYEHTAGIHATDNLYIGYNTTFAGAAANGTYRVLGASATLVAGTAVLGDGVVAADRFGGLNVDVSGASISFGRFTQNVNGTLGFTADANGFSTINVTGTGDGTVTLGGTLWVDFGLYEGSAPELILISNAGSGPISGTFDSVELLNNTRGYELTYSGGTGNDLALVSGDPQEESYEEWVSGFGLEGEDALEDADPDGDGRTNLEEFLFGTDPTDPTSRFEVGASMNQEGGFEITFETVEGRSYQVERSVDLSAGNWTPVGTALEGHGGSKTVIDNEIGERAFYRVTVQLL